MAAHVLVMQGARASTAMVLTYFQRSKFEKFLFTKYKKHIITEWRLKPTRIYVSRPSYSIHITQ